MFAFAYDDYCWSIIHFAHDLIHVTAALLALPSWPIPIINLLTVIPSEELIEEYYRITNNEFTTLVPRVRIEFSRS